MSLNIQTNLYIVLYQLKLGSTPLCNQVVQDSNPGQETGYLKVFRGISQSLLENARQCIKLGHCHFLPRFPIN
jgi:hypothetical protein